MSTPSISCAVLAIVLLLVRHATATDNPPALDIAAPTPQAIVDNGTRCSPEVTRPLAAATRPTLVPFQTSPFPYDGKIPADDKPFLDYEEDGQRGHTSPRGSLHLEKEAYSDRRSLLYLPTGFDLSRPEQALIVVFFHGNFARLQQDVGGRQRVPRQLAESGLNAALVAPQFAVNIADSSAGNFWQPNFFKQYLAEAAVHLAVLRGDPCTRTIFDRLGVVLVAYSGGYNPAAYALDIGGADARIRGVILLDALYGETDRFDRWIGRRGSAFFFSAYSNSSRVENLRLRRALTAQNVEIDAPTNPLRLGKASVTFVFAGAGIDHKAFVTSAWVRDPLKLVLSAVEGFHVAATGREPATARPNSPSAWQRKTAPANQPPPVTGVP